GGGGGGGARGRGDGRAGGQGFARAPVARRAGSRQRFVERALGGTDLAEPRQRLGVHRVRLRLAGRIAELRQVLGGGGDGVGGRLQRPGRGEYRQLAGEAGVPRPETGDLGNPTSEFIDCRARQCDVTR